MQQIYNYKVEKIRVLEYYLFIVGFIIITFDLTYLKHMLMFCFNIVI